MEKAAETVAKILLEIKGITFNPTKPFRYASGILSPVYVDCRLLMGYPDKRKQVTHFLSDAIMSTGETFDCVAGTATAGIPHAAWVADILNLPMIYARNKAKDHGKENTIEGILKKNQKVAVIEDLISTAESSVNTVKSVRTAGAAASFIFCIITYGMEKAKENITVNNITLIPLTTFETVVTVAEKNNYIKRDQKQTILDWITNPSEWGKKMGFE